MSKKPVFQVGRFAGFCPKIRSPLLRKTHFSRSSGAFRKIRDRILKALNVLFQMSIGLWGRIPAVSNLAPELCIFPVFGLVPPPKRKNGKKKVFCLKNLSGGSRMVPDRFAQHFRVRRTGKKYRDRYGVISLFFGWGATFDFRQILHPGRPPKWPWGVFWARYLQNAPIFEFFVLRV